jgi:ABC-type branched-subunit amino acid transport system ATPase component
VLILDKIIKHFGDVRVLNGVNFRLEAGNVYTLKGGNGSGKTTLFNMISRFLKPTSGTIRFSGHGITKFVPYRINRVDIGRTFQDLRLATQMTVQENILLALEKKMFAFPTRPQKNRTVEILEKVSLNEKRNELAGEISYGQQKLLTLGCIARTRPAVGYLPFCSTIKTCERTAFRPSVTLAPSTKIGNF